MASSVPRDDLAGLTRLSCSFPKPDVVSLDGLRHVPGLTSLSLVGTSLSSVGPADALSRVEHLSLTATGVRDLAPLADLPALTSLSLGDRCWDTAEPYDLDALTEVAALTDLSLSCLDVQDLAPVGRLTGLTQLSLHALPARDLRPLSSLESLTVLVVREMPDVDLRPLRALPSLRSTVLDGVETSR